MKTESQGAAVPAEAAWPARGPGNVAHSGRVLAGLGLVTAFGHVSARVAGGMTITPAADLATVREEDLVYVDLNAAALPPGAPAEAWAHLGVYAARPDVGAIARAQPPAAFAAGAATAGELPLLHGQACWLGDRVPVHDDARLLRTRVLAERAAAALGGSDALILSGNGALTCGADPGQAVTRMWLLSAACEAWLAAAPASVPGRPRLMRVAEREAWRAVQGELLPRLWRHLESRAAGPAVREVAG